MEAERFSFPTLFFIPNNALWHSSGLSHVGAKPFSPFFFFFSFMALQAATELHVHHDNKGVHTRSASLISI